MADSVCVGQRNGGGEERVVLFLKVLMMMVVVDFLPTLLMLLMMMLLKLQRASFEPTLQMAERAGEELPEELVRRMRSAIR